jgi:hypothetical protein
MHIQLFEHVISADVHIISPGFRRFGLSGYKLMAFDRHRNYIAFNYKGLLAKTSRGKNSSQVLGTYR